MDKLFDRYFEECQDEIKSLLLGCLKEMIVTKDNQDFANLDKFADTQVEFPSEPMPSVSSERDYKAKLAVDDFYIKDDMVYPSPRDSRDEENIAVVRNRRANLIASFNCDALLAQFEAKNNGNQATSPEPESKSDDGTANCSTQGYDPPLEEKVDVATPPPEVTIVTPDLKVEVVTPPPDVVVDVKPPVVVAPPNTLPNVSKKRKIDPLRDEYGRLVSAKGCYPNEPKFLRLGPERLYATAIEDRRPTPNIKVSKGRLRWNKSTANMANSKIYENPFKHGKMSLRDARLIAGVTSLEFGDEEAYTITRLKYSCITHFPKTLELLKKDPDILRHVTDENARILMTFLKHVMFG